MRRFFVILGIVLMVFAFTILTLFIIAPAVVTLDDAPFLKSIMQTIACQPGEELSASYSTYRTPGTTTRSTQMSCVNNEGQERDASSQIIGIGTVGYLVPFLVGLFMTLLAANGSGKSKPKTTSGFNSSTVGYSAERPVSTADDRRAKLEAVRKDMEKLAAAQAHSDSSQEHIPLAQRLQELKDAYSAGLITEAEYTTKREALLNEV